MFFNDVPSYVRSIGGRGIIFVDDLNIFLEFDRLHPLYECRDNLKQCRNRVHNWGRINRISFDNSKEYTVILHPSYGHGDCFKLQGLRLHD